MGAVAAVVRKALREFRVAKIMTVAQLTVLLNCSVRTVRRRLKEWDAVASYNCNGRFHTLPDVARFDAEGLWNCGEARFSRYGNLTVTVAALVRQAEAGLTAAELSAKLGVDAHSFISQLVCRADIARSKVHGRYVYVAAERQLAEEQRRRRRHGDVPEPSALPADAEAVVIFAEMLRRPAENVQGIARRVQARGTAVDPEGIRLLLRHHDLPPKGGAADSP